MGGQVAKIAEQFGPVAIVEDHSGVGESRTAAQVPEFRGRGESQSNLFSNSVQADVRWLGYQGLEYFPPPGRTGGGGVDRERM
jgi:hypothetical protein